MMCAGIDRRKVPQKQHKGGITCEEHLHRSVLKCAGYMFSMVHMWSVSHWFWFLVEWLTCKL